ncbi:hypothetical protein UZ36_00315 [Candidatus Nitromaritima sp. SCGC AAA799-C22]|nr:hypothetical protein UZ36_00315 [Candidatus Nitromaritima sp. SCGC AAA799-C22]
MVKESAESIQARLDVLSKSLVSEENSVQYYETLLNKTPTDTESDLGTRRMYQELREEELKHVATIQSLIERWEDELKSIQP